jgi:hypothetical protein
MVYFHVRRIPEIYGHIAGMCLFNQIYTTPWHIPDISGTMVHPSNMIFIHSDIYLGHTWIIPGIFFPSHSLTYLRYNYTWSIDMPAIRPAAESQLKCSCTRILYCRVFDSTWQPHRAPAGPAAWNHRKRCAAVDCINHVVTVTDSQLHQNLNCLDVAAAAAAAAKNNYDAQTVSSTVGDTMGK